MGKEINNKIVSKDLYGVFTENETVPEGVHQLWTVEGGWKG